MLGGMRGLVMLVLAGCGQQYWSNGVRPTPRGEARVVLVGRAGAWVPVACYDPHWVRLAGPADCADLIPPRSQVLVPTGELRMLGPRRPAACAETRAVGFPEGGAAGLAVWPPSPPPAWTAIDLDADGQAERIEVAGEGARVWRGEKIIGACVDDR